MKKNSSDASSIGDLLKKLHASYLGGNKKAEKPTKTESTASADDSAILKQLKATLDKVSSPIQAKKSKAKAQKETVVDTAPLPKAPSHAKVKEPPSPTPTQAEEKPIKKSAPKKQTCAVKGLLSELLITVAVDIMRRISC